MPSVNVDPSTLTGAQTCEDGAINGSSIVPSLPRVALGEVTCSSSDGRICTAADGSAAAGSGQPVILEYCCSPKSLLSRMENKCKVIRITKETRTTRPQKVWKKQNLSQYPIPERYYGPAYHAPPGAHGGASTKHAPMAGRPDDDAFGSSSLSSDRGCRSPRS